MGHTSETLVRVPQYPVPGTKAPASLDRMATLTTLKPDPTLSFGCFFNGDSLTGSVVDYILQLGGERLRLICDFCDYD